MPRPFIPPTTADVVLDISHHNGSIHFPEVAADGIKAVFIKSTQGSDYADPLFLEHSAGAAAAGLLWAPYHFVTGDDPADQWRNIKEVIHIYSGLIALDWETKDADADLVADLGQMIAAEIGRLPLMYCGRWQLSEPHPVLSQWPLWLPEYGNRPICPPGWTKWHLHQYTDHASCRGIKGHVDHSVFAGTAEDLEAWWKNEKKKT